MMKSFFFVALAAVLAVGCQHGARNVIEGTVEGLEPGDRIVLATGTITETPLPVDSTVVREAGRFTLRTAASDTYASLYLLRGDERLDVQKSIAVGLFLEGYARIRAEGDTDGWRYLKFTGGLYDLPQMEALCRIQTEGLAVQRKARELLDRSREYASSESYHPDSLKAMRDHALSLLRESNDILDQRDPLEETFVTENPDLAYSAELHHFNHRMMRRSIDRYDSVFHALTPRVQATPAGRSVAQYIASHRATEVGGMAPDFAREDMEGQMLRLSDLRGRYVLLDFWGTWCGPCRASIPRLKACYEKLKGYPFEIVGIALDEQDESTWKEVVRTEGMTWRHAIDLRFEPDKKLRTTYAIMGVPTCFLLDPNGKIVLKGHPASILDEVEAIVIAAGTGR